MDPISLSLLRKELRRRAPPPLLRAQFFFSVVLLLLGLAIYNVFAGGFGQAITWLFTPDFSKISFATVLAAVGQAFFSIGVAMAGMMVYGAYLPRSISITQSVLVIVFADTMVALLAGLVIFPAVFHNGLDPEKQFPVCFAAGGVMGSLVKGEKYIKNTRVHGKL